MKRKPELDEILRRILNDVETPPSNDVPRKFFRIGEVGQRLPPQHMVAATFLLSQKGSFVTRPSEKVAWAITFDYKGVASRIRFEKLGLSLYSSSELAEGFIDNLIKTLNRAARVTDRILQPVLEEKIKNGHVTVRNMFNILDGRYLFFRKLAETAFASEPPPPVIIHTSPDGRLTGWEQDIFKPEREGFHYGSAAIEAYFSKLEHLFVLLLAFAKFDATKDNLVASIDSNWAEKMKRIFNFDSDHKAQRLYCQLRNVKERLRNPFSHGAFEKDGASLFVHMPPLGAVPSRLPQIGDGERFSFYPLQPVSFGAACSVFDSVDRYLEDGPLRLGYSYVRRVLDVSFDAESIAEYEAAAKSDKDFDELIERKVALHDVMANMDW